MLMSTMTDADKRSSNPIMLLYPELEGELAMTRKILAIVPWEHADWKPHPRSGSLRSLACHVAQLPDFAMAMATMDVLHFKPEDFKAPDVRNTDELVAMFDAKVATLHGALSALDWQKLDGTWKMQMGDNVIISGQRAALLRHMGINHLVHHRAQLGVYLRLLDVKIPGAYGPSADS
jgi:uncharacterized damage-inducible protein DinB